MNGIEAMKVVRVETASAEGQTWSPPQGSYDTGVGGGLPDRQVERNRAGLGDRVSPSNRGRAGDRRTLV